MNPLPHIVFKNLADCQIDELTYVFNRSFSDYFVEIQLSEAQMARKIANENIDLELSIGAFHNGKLIGFILHAKSVSQHQQFLYNAGTGVVPEYRGSKLTQRMYEWVIPKLKTYGISYVVLEVIEENSSAIKSYENVGFRQKRKLKCYKGNLKGREHPEVRLYAVSQFDFSRVSSLWTWDPSHQNTIEFIARAENNKVVFLEDEAQNLLGYVVFSINGRIHQFAVQESYQRRGYGTRLFEYVALFSEKVSTINVDGNAAGTLQFLESMGMENYINQNEMVLQLD